MWLSLAFFYSIGEPHANPIDPVILSVPQCRLEQEQDLQIVRSCSYTPVALILFCNLPNDLKRLADIVRRHVKIRHRANPVWPNCQDPDTIGLSLFHEF